MGKPVKPVDLGETNPSRHLVNYMSIHIWWCFFIADSIHFLGWTSQQERHQCSFSRCLSRKEPILPKDGTVFSVPFTNKTMPEPSLENLRANMPEICRGTLQLVQFQLLKFKQQIDATKLPRNPGVLDQSSPIQFQCLKFQCTSSRSVFRRAICSSGSSCKDFRFAVFSRSFCWNEES